MMAHEKGLRKAQIAERAVRGGGRRARKEEPFGTTFLQAYITSFLFINIC
jgi:hypothetical protein